MRAGVAAQVRSASTASTRFRFFCFRFWLVAVPISDISLAIFGAVHPDAPDRGRDLALALQLTNICRDVGEDVGRDRIYLPLDELARFGVEYFRAPDPQLGTLALGLSMGQWLSVPMIGVGAWFLLAPPSPRAAKA